MHCNQNDCQEEESKDGPFQEPRVDLPRDVDMAMKADRHLTKAFKFVKDIFSKSGGDARK